ncbi:hypothetical protein RFI_32666 [Reticulomyxa filosa]|uniref:Uncharacterized protein n=1 Tax=Reticulomyxa filosa TaxID=46433 RepID=X6LVH2_RETFI|nr:hypothetical protein RFI_32666 [Reticulomyxa filosa]|eukprot:ETO04730.1 hypothetical protein RFI_32666 [Reticulomyxa filosa]
MNKQIKKVTDEQVITIAVTSKTKEVINITKRKKREKKKGKKKKKKREKNHIFVRSDVHGDFENFHYREKKINKIKTEQKKRKLSNTVSANLMSDSNMEMISKTKPNKKTKAQKPK